MAGTGAWRAAPGRGRLLRQPGSLPYPGLPPGTDTIPQIEHVVVVMMENTPTTPDRPAHHADRRRRGHGLLAGRRPALLLLRVPAVPDRGPLLLLGPRPDLPELAVPAGRDLDHVGTKIVSIADFFTDAAAGTLPGYSLVEPGYSNQSEENPQNIAVGEEFAASVINAVISGPA